MKEKLDDIIEGNELTTDRMKYLMDKFRDMPKILAQEMNPEELELNRITENEKYLQGRNLGLNNDRTRGK